MPLEGPRGLSETRLAFRTTYGQTQLECVAAVFALKLG